MSTLHPSQICNRLLSRLAEPDFACLADHLELVDCPCGMSICEPYQPSRYMIFPEAGVVSIVVSSAKGLTAECGVVGREGFVSSSVILGVDQVPHRVAMQIAGHGYKVPTGKLLDVFSRNENIRTLLLRFTQVLNIQTSYTAMTNALYTADQRLSRLILMYHDRSQGDDLRLTHGFMSVMLGIRRASVSEALQKLEAKHLITTQRGYVLIQNRAALEAFAGGAYGVPEAEYRRLLGPP